MRRTGCKVTINQDFPEGQPRKIVFSGHPSSIQGAKELVAAVISEGAIALQTGVSGSISVPSGSNSYEAPEVSEMDCPQDKVGLVIGAKGAVIQDIMRRTGCKIVLNQDFPDGQPRKVIFNGKASQINEAKNLISSIIAKGTTSGVLSGTDNAAAVTRCMDCPQEKVGLVIGAKGIIIQEMMRRTHCKIVLNQDFPDGQPRKIMFTGTDEQIDAAIELVNSVIALGPGALHSTGPNVVTQDINIVQAQVGRIIGPGGITIKEIQQRCGVKMVVEQEFADSEDRKIRISGDAQRVQNAVMMVCQILEHGSSAVTGPGAAAFAAPTGSYYGAAAPAVAGALALGADGQAGQLLPATLMSNGMHQQVLIGGVLFALVNA